MDLIAIGAIAAAFAIWLAFAHWEHTQRQRGIPEPQVLTYFEPVAEWLEARDRALAREAISPLDELAPELPPSSGRESLDGSGNRVLSAEAMARRLRPISLARSAGIAAPQRLGAAQKPPAGARPTADGSGHGAA
jgi:hypothetical protein